MLALSYFVRALKGFNDLVEIVFNVRSFFTGQLELPSTLEKRVIFSVITLYRESAIFPQGFVHAFVSGVGSDEGHRPLQLGQAKIKQVSFRIRHPLISN